MERARMCPEWRKQQACVRPVSSACFAAPMPFNLVPSRSRGQRVARSFPFFFFLFYFVFKDVFLYFLHMGVWPTCMFVHEYVCELPTEATTPWNRNYRRLLVLWGHRGLNLASLQEWPLLLTSGGGPSPATHFNFKFYLLFVWGTHKRTTCGSHFCHGSGNQTQAIRLAQQVL